MGIDIENFILETLEKQGHIEYDDLIDLVKENYCANYQTIYNSIQWLYCQGKLDMKIPWTYQPYYANIGEITLKTHPITS